MDEPFSDRTQPAYRLACDGTPVPSTGMAAIELETLKKGAKRYYLRLHHMRIAEGLGKDKPTGRR